MFVKNFNGIDLYQFDNLSKFPELAHYVSGRSAGSFQSSFNLSFKVGDEQVASKNRLSLAEAFNVAPNCMLFPNQTHSTNVKVIHDHSDQDLDDTDALITAVPGIFINILSADCVPILLFDPKRKVVGARHSGWRGTVAKIVTKTVHAMQENFSSDPQDIIAAIGPSICPEIYEVGSEVVASAKQTFPKFLEKVILDNNNKFYFDLWQANFLLLLEAGIRNTSIEIAEICTFNNTDKFFSARREGLATGRFAAGIILQSTV